MSQSKPRGGTPIVSMLISLVLIIVALATLQAGIGAIENGQLELALLYLSVTVFAFGFVTFSILRVRRGFSLPSMLPSKVMSVVLCTKCSFKQIRNFNPGDYVLKMAGNCTQCGNPSLLVNSIYAEDLKR